MNKSFTETIKTWIKLWPDLWAGLVILAGIWGSYYLLYYLDPTIGTFDLGVLQALLFTVAVIVTLNAVAFLGIEFNDKELWRYYKDKYDSDKRDTYVTDESDFIHLTPWQRIKLLYFWRAFLLLLGVVIFVNLI